MSQRIAAGCEKYFGVRVCRSRLDSLTKAFSRQGVVPPLKRVRAIAGLLSAMVVGLAVWSFALEPASLTTRHYRLSIPHWHADLTGLRIAVLADLHVGSPFNGIPKLHEIVAITNELKPDLILIPGDFVIEDVIGGGLVPPEDSAAVPIKRGADHFWLVGISNFWEGASDVRKAMNLVTDDAPVLLFTHNPDVFPKLIRQ